MVTQRKVTRRARSDAGTTRTVKPKFMEERQQKVQSKPIIPMNDKQREYIDLINEKNVIVATGYPGTSKTYLPTAIAADLYKLGQINKIYITRPAVSTSKSIGYTKGSFLEKMTPGWEG